MKCLPSGESEYLAEKGVKAFDVRFTQAGTLVIPMCDNIGNVHGLQFIGPEVRRRRKDRNKDFWPSGLTKRGHYHLIGRPGSVILLAEGYATAASLHEATGHAVVVAFDAGNLPPVAAAIHERYPRARLLVCADDDWLGKCPGCQKLTPSADPACTHCGADTSRLKNAGLEYAEAAALAVGGAHVLPVFTDRGMRKLTDFNDLQLGEGQHAVRSQIDAKFVELGWSGVELPRPTSGQGAGTTARPGHLHGRTVRPVRNHLRPQQGAV
ncbi:MAG: toprim domain-containing protein [Comamonadaceae bacterium]|nr:toprim domain-containing protein [Comamonadaceae bacterium]